MAGSDPHGKRKVMVAVGPRPVLSLLDLERYEPVLASSPRSYMVADAHSPSAAAPQDFHYVEDDSLLSVTELELADTGHNPVQVLPRTPPPPPYPPRRQKADNAVGASPRARVRPLPPVGIAAREDVDIYRYSQAAEQRMAIRPLFERRREVEAAESVDKLYGSEENGEAEALQSTATEVAERDENQASAAADLPVIYSNEPDASAHDTTRSNDGACQHGVGLDASDTEADTDIVDEIGYDEQSEQHEERNPNGQQIRFVSAMDLSLANCHEPFLTSEPPLMRKIRTVMPRTPQDTTKVTQPELLSANRGASGKLSPPSLKKLIWSGSRTFDDQRVAVSIMVASDGSISIAYTDPSNERQETADGNSKPAVVTLTDNDLTLMKKLRADLTDLTPEWANWLASRLTLRDGNSIQLDLDEMNSSKGIGSEHIFSKIVTLSNDNANESTEDRKIVVDVFLVQEETTLTIRIEDAQSKQMNKLHLNKFELQTIAGAIDPIYGDVDVDGLLHNSAFLNRLCESNAVRLAMAMLSTQTLNPVDGDHEFEPKLTGWPSFQATTQEIGVESYVLNDSQDEEEIRALICNSGILTSIALLAQAHSDSVMLAAIRMLSQQEAMLMCTNHYIAHAEETEATDPSFEASIRQRMEAAKADRFNRLAFASILDDLLLDLLRTECQAAHHEARYSSEFRGHFAAKIQATFRMSRQKRAYAARQQERQLAARAIQARQRGITSRRRLRSLQVDRDRMLHYGIAKSTHDNNQDPTLPMLYDLGHRVTELLAQAERVHRRLLMQVLTGYALNATSDKPSDEDGISTCVVQAVLNKFGPAIARYSSGLGESVTQILSDMMDVKEEPSASSCFSSNQISAALLLALRTSHGESSPWIVKQSHNQEQQRQLSAQQLSLQFGNNACVPRWILKANAAIRRENCERHAKICEERHAVGQEAALYVARSYRSMLAKSLAEFEQSRRVWEEVASAHEREEKALDDADACVNQLAQQCLDLMVASIKERGVDTDPLLEALNLCYLGDHGKQAVAIAEERFDGLAAALNETAGRVSILSLRDEIAQELDEFDKLLAMRCLDLARGIDSYQLPPVGALLHTVLRGQLHDEQVRLALPAVLPIASVSDKFGLARRMVRGYAGSAFGEALNQVCWSCVDGTERTSAEAAQFADLLTRLSDDEDAEFDLSEGSSDSGDQDRDDSSEQPSTTATTVASRALARLTGAAFVRFLQFLVWVAHANASLQTHVRLLLSPMAAEYELVRIASALSALENARDASALYAQRFSREAIKDSDAFWVQYQTQFGQEARARALESCARHGE